MTDTQEYCCAAGVCCDRDMQIAAMIHLLITRAHLSESDAAHATEVILASFDFLPIAAGLREVVTYVQAHPYRSMR